MKKPNKPVPIIPGMTPGDSQAADDEPVFAGDLLSDLPLLPRRASRPRVVSLHTVNAGRLPKNKSDT